MASKCLFVIGTLFTFGSPTKAATDVVCGIYKDGTNSQEKEYYQCMYMDMVQRIILCAGDVEGPYDFEEIKEAMDFTPPEDVLQPITQADAFGDLTYVFDDEFMSINSRCVTKVVKEVLARADLGAHKSTDQSFVCEDKGKYSGKSKLPGSSMTCDQVIATWVGMNASDLAYLRNGHELGNNASFCDADLTTGALNPKSLANAGYLQTTPSMKSLLEFLEDSQGNWKSACCGGEKLVEMCEKRYYHGANIGSTGITLLVAIFTLVAGLLLGFLAGRMTNNMKMKRQNSQVNPAEPPNMHSESTRNHATHNDADDKHSTDSGTAC